ncbi:tetraspanin-1-like isoform X2 [Gopherus flavomarginatus]|uniref:tetraspanin-1-like isoform X2 n=1 Tax=Gopherus flavomarginatus TaxID=286002 RepID=UPI0021CC44A3|nr:tetraspanin-1-like isoform X2 [Gopherus flavomarginatus]
MGCFSFLKLMMFVFNGVIFLSGLAVLGIGIWVKVDGGSFVQILGAAAPQLMQLINVGYLCIAVGTFLLLMGFLGCCGAMKESKCMLLLFFVIILILFIAEVAGAVVVLAFSSVADIFIEHLKNWAVKTLREDYGRRDDVTAIWDTTMKEPHPPSSQTVLAVNLKRSCGCKPTGTLILAEMLWLQQLQGFQQLLLLPNSQPDLSHGLLPATQA